MIWQPNNLGLVLRKSLGVMRFRAKMVGIEHFLNQAGMLPKTARLANYQDRLTFFAA